MGFKHGDPNCTMCREWKTLEHSVLKGMDIFIKSFTSVLRELCRTVGGETVRARVDRWLQGNCLSDPTDLTWLITYELTETVASGTRPVQVEARWNPSTDREKWTPGPTATQEAVCKWYTYCQRKHPLSLMDCPGYMNHTPGKAMRPEVVSLRKQTQW